MRSWIALIVVSSLLIAGGVAAGRTKLDLGTLNVDGMEMRGLSCELEEGGLMASVVILAAMSKQKAALDACAPSGGAFQVRWTWKKGKPAGVSVVRASDPARSSCVSGVLAKSRADLTGSCEATLLVGDPDGARRAAEKLGKK